jgi:predicted XRE-type DNA-binding protein
MADGRRTQRPFGEARFTISDLGETMTCPLIFAPPGALYLPEAVQMKAELTRQIYNRITALGLTQREAGKRLGLKQPDVSKLMQGRFTGFSADRLLALLNALEVDVDIVLRPHSEPNEQRGIVRVVEATA